MYISDWAPRAVGEPSRMPQMGLLGLVEVFHSGAACCAVVVVLVRWPLCDMRHVHHQDKEWIEERE